MAKKKKRKRIPRPKERNDENQARWGFEHLHVQVCLQGPVGYIRKPQRIFI